MLRFQAQLLARDFSGQLAPCDASSQLVRSPRAHDARAHDAHDAHAQAAAQAGATQAATQAQAATATARPRPELTPGATTGGSGGRSGAEQCALARSPPPHSAELWSATWARDGSACAAARGSRRERCGGYLKVGVWKSVS